MNRTGTEPDPDEHFQTLDQLLTRLNTHGSAEKKGIYGQYLRRLEFYRETRGEQSREIVIRWVESENLETQPQS